MKLKAGLLAILLVFTLGSCKDPKEQSEVKTPEVSLIDPSRFVVVLNATIKKDDNFQIYYRQTEDQAFDEKRSLFVEVKGKNVPQDVIFTLPEDVLPEFIRLDFGVNKSQEPIKINTFSINFADKKFEVSGANFFNYMQVEEKTIKVDKTNAIVTPFETNGSYDPISSSGLGLKAEIDKLVKG